MKTKTNISPIAKMSLSAVAFLMTSVAVNAGETSYAAAALESLEVTATSIEETLKYKAPESAEAYFVSEFELTGAFERLEAINGNLEATLNYEAPEFTEDVEVYELQAAMERLESFHLAQEESIKF
jgi:hypothetical protein